MEDVQESRNFNTKWENKEIMEENNEIFKSELVNDGGKHKVPCLKIEKTNAKTEWLYESDEIILFLKKIIAS